MAMRDGAGTPLNPANLWGKPDPRKAAQIAKQEEEKNVPRMDEEPADDEIDVDAELDESAADEIALEATIGDTDDDNEEYEDDGAKDIRETAAELDDDDDDDFEPEEGDEEEEEDVDDDADAELEDETTASTADEVEEESPAAVTKTDATSSRKRKMSDKKTSLSDHIRSEIARRQEAGEELRGKDIVASLASRRIKVSPAQVSQILKKEGLSSGARGRRPKAAEGERSRTALKTKRPEAKKAAVPVGRVAPKVRPSADGFHVPLEQLQAAEMFVKACGGSFKAAEGILTAAAQLSQSFSG